ncbi:MAG TPA: hypothetical protein VFU88_03245 [Ktedonobacterales bacterium]|nr:hypothetical protein [Ktedonobacterales bacterium]
MSLSTTRKLYLSAIGLAIIGVIVFFVGAAGATTSVDPTTGLTQVSGGNPALALVATLVFIVAGIVSFIAWIGALIATAKMGRWGWFVLILVLSGIGMLAYVIAGPQAPAQAMAYAPPQQR